MSSSFGATLLVALVALSRHSPFGVRNEEAEAALLGAFLSLYLALALLHVKHISVACVPPQLSAWYGDCYAVPTPWPIVMN